MKAGDQVFVLEIQFDDCGMSDFFRGCYLWHATYEYEADGKISVRTPTLFGHKHHLISKDRVYSRRDDVLDILMGAKKK